MPHEDHQLDDFSLHPSRTRLRVVSWLLLAAAICFFGLTIGMLGLWLRSYHQAEAFDWIDHQLLPSDSATDYRSSLLGIVSVNGSLRLERQVNWGSLFCNYGEIGRPTQRGWHRMSTLYAIDVWPQGPFGGPMPGLTQHFALLGFAIITRHFHEAGGFDIVGWHATIPDPAVVFLGAIATVIFLRKARLLRYAAHPGLCRRCGYDLRASPHRCPECGHHSAPAG